MPLYRTAAGTFTPDPAKAGSTDALARFAAKCQFDPLTGCVLWIGGRTRGRGNTAEYGSFWFEGRRVFAHRWSCVHIHGHDLSGGLTAGHFCPGGGRSLCVEHVRPETLSENVAERNARKAALSRAEQSGVDRQYWLLVERGYEPAPAEPVPDPGAIPFYTPPEWLRPFLPASGGDCPF